MKFKIFFSLFVTSIALYACNGHHSSSSNINEKIPGRHGKTPKLTIKGQILFEQKCAACHGNDGTAGIGNAANLQATKLDSASVAKIITEGKNGMPSFGVQLTTEEIAAISGYVLMLRQ